MFKETITEQPNLSTTSQIGTSKYIDEKKEDDIKPTDTGYDCEPDMFSGPVRSSFMPLRTRPSFSLFAAEEHHDINEDIAMLSKKRQMESIEVLPFCKKVSLASNDEDVKECHSSFMDYIGKLGSLMK